MKTLKLAALLSFFVFLNSCKVFVSERAVHKHKDYISLIGEVKDLKAQNDTLQNECDKKVEELKIEKEDYRKDYFKCLNDRIDILTENNALLEKFDLFKVRNDSLLNEQIRLQEENHALQEDSVRTKQELMNLQTKYINIMENARSFDIPLDSLLREHSRRKEGSEQKKSSSESKEDNEGE